MLSMLTSYNFAHIIFPVMWSTLDRNIALVLLSWVTIPELVIIDIKSIRKSSFGNNWISVMVIVFVYQILVSISS